MTKGAGILEQTATACCSALPMIRKRTRDRVSAPGPARARILFGIIGWSGLLAMQTFGQSRDSLAGERAAQRLGESIDAREYNLSYGPVRYRTAAALGLSYTDNVFYSQNREADVLVKPEVTLDASWPVTELNELTFSVGLAYEWYLDHTELNGDAPLVNPGTELAFNLFAGDFRIRLHERFHYLESIFFNGFAGAEDDFFNLNDVGTFSRLNNEVGFRIDWDLNRLVISTTYEHENFVVMTDSLEYLTRASEWVTASAEVPLGDGFRAGLETQTSWHDYDQETVLDDHWRLRAGPFAELVLQEGWNLRGGGGYDFARYDTTAAGDSDYDSFYGYARVQHITRLFSHSLTAGHEHLLGANANNLRTTYARYAVSSPIIAHVDLTATLSVNFAEEFGGPDPEEFTYYVAGFRAGSQFHKHWRADLGYEFRLKESDVPLREFHRNRVSLSTTFSF